MVDVGASVVEERRSWIYYESVYRWLVYKASYVHFSKFYRREKLIVCLLLYSCEIQTEHILSLFNRYK